jgi:ParB-like chromosome segregation protein Spo0J
MEVLQIAVEALSANSWNVNRMSPGMMKKLTAYLKREGLVEPIVVRPHPTHDGRYEILGGFHRWTICKDQLGYQTVPCVVLKGLDDRRAKILSINLNSMKGETVPSLLSDLLHDLQQEMPLADMEFTLPYDAGEIVDVLSLMQLPDDFADELEDEAQRMDDEAPTVLTLVLDKRQAEQWDRAVEMAKDEVGGARNPKARTLEVITGRYLEARRSAQQGGADP